MRTHAPASQHVCSKPTPLPELLRSLPSSPIGPPVQELQGATCLDMKLPCKGQAGLVYKKLAQPSQKKRLSSQESTRSRVFLTAPCVSKTSSGLEEGKQARSRVFLTAPWLTWAHWKRGGFRMAILTNSVIVRGATRDAPS